MGWPANLRKGKKIEGEEDKEDTHSRKVKKKK